MRLDDGLVPRMVGPRRVDQAPVVAGQLGVGAVDLRVIQVRLAHPGLEVVRSYLRRDPAEELERGHVRLGPGPLGHAHGRADEQVPRVRQHHRERPHPAAPARRRIGPQPQVPVIHLGLGTRRRRRPRRPHQLGPYLAREMRPHVPAQAGHARGQALLIGQPLVDHRHRHHGQQPGDPVMMNCDLPPGHLPYPGPGQLREPLPGQRPPLLLAHRRAPWRHPGRLRRGHVPADGLRIDPQAAGHLDLRPARIPVLQDLRDIDHGERPPCHLGPPSEADERHIQLEGPGAEPPRPNRHGLGKTLIEGVGNYRLCREFCDVLLIVRCLGGLCRLRLVLGM